MRMKFFKERGDQGRGFPVPTEKDAINSVIGAEMTISGDIAFKGKVRIDGNVRGNVKGEYFILSESGHVTGDIETVCFLCHGSVDGNVASDRISVTKTAVINGNVEAAELSVEAGASLKGEISARSKDLRLVQDTPVHAEAGQVSCSRA